MAMRPNPAAVPKLTSYLPSRVAGAWSARWGLAVAALVLAPGAGHAQAGGKPNIVVVVVDDLDQVVSAPYLDKVMSRSTALARTGITFTAAFTQTSICCPARATLLTGQCGHNTQVLTNGGPTGGYRTFRRVGLDDRTVARTLSAAGYRTAMIGKYLNQYELHDGRPPPVPQGWTDWHAIVDPGVKGYRGYGYHLLHSRDGGKATVQAYGKRDADYSTDVIRDLALEVIDRQTKRDPAAPLFLYLAPTAPHAPLPPARRHVAMTQQWKGTLPTDRPNYFQDGRTVDDKPEWLRSSWFKRTHGVLRKWTEREWSERLGTLYAVDELVAAVVERLKQHGRWEDTLLVVVSDNGYNLGAHGLIHKMAPYEESIRVPMFLVAGERLAIPGARQEKRWVVLADLAPTFLELAGLPVSEEMDGRSLVPLLRPGADASPWRKDLLLEYLGGGAANGLGIAEEYRHLVDIITPAFLLDIPTYRALRAQWDDGGQVRTWKYIAWESGAQELYDLDQDPWENDNLLHGGGAAQQATVERLKARLTELRTCKGKGCW